MQQTGCNHLPSTLLDRLAARPLPDSHHRRRVGIYKSFDAFDQIVLKSAASIFTVGIDLQSSGPLALQCLEDGLVFDSAEFA